MSVSVTLETKNNASLALESKDTGLTWDEATSPWDIASGTWDVPGAPLSLETKNDVSLTLESR